MRNPVETQAYACRPPGHSFRPIASWTCRGQSRRGPTGNASSSPPSLLGGRDGQPECRGRELAIHPSTGAGQRGVIGAHGINTIGLLIRTFGRFTFVDSHTFTVDDGSGNAVKCVAPDGVAINSGWHYARVTGVCSCESSGGNLAGQSENSGRYHGVLGAP